MGRIDRAIDRRLDKISGDTDIFLRLFKSAPQDSNYSIYKESAEKEYHEDIPFKAVVRINPSDRVIQETGLDEQVEIIARLSMKRLRMAGLVNRKDEVDLALDRDRLIVDELEYEIIDIAPIVQYKGRQRMVAIGGVRA